MELQQTGQDDFSVSGIIDGIKQSMYLEKSSVFYSWTNFWDMATLILTLICGLYALWLFIQTFYYVKQQSSLVEYFKQDKYSNPRLYK